MNRNNLRRAFAVCASFALAGAACLAQTPQKTVLLELFTSEGCSSCPPADALLATLDGNRIPSGELVVGLSEHVTYWNSLGWRDPFSAELWTQRQNGYGNRFGLESVYTPQAVVNGQLQLVGSDGRGLLKALQSAEASPLKLALDDLQVADGKVKLRYTLAGGPPAGAELWAVVADDRAASQVQRGENGGRRLAHVAVARTLTRLAKAVDGSASAQLLSPEILKDQPQTGRHLVLFVQESGFGRVLAVVSRPLEPVRLQPPG